MRYVTNYGMIYSPKQAKTTSANKEGSDETGKNVQNRQGGGSLAMFPRGRIVMFRAAVCVMAMATALFADETIDADTQLAADRTVSGALYLADGTTLAIRLGGNHVRNPLISWTTPPANLGTLAFVKADGESGYSLKVKDDGLYAVRRFQLIVR